MAEEMKLDSSYWRKLQPEELTKECKPLMKALVDYEGAMRDFERDDKVENVDTVMSALKEIGVQGGKIELVLKKAIKTNGKAKTQEKPSKPNQGPEALKKALKVLNTLDTAIDKAANALESLTADPTGDELDYQASLADQVKRMKRRPMQFGLVLNGAKPLDHRIRFDLQKNGRAILNDLLKESGPGKKTFGVAQFKLDPEDEENADEDTPATLWLRLEGPELPGLCKNLRKHFKAYGIKKVKQVQLLQLNSSFSRLKEALQEKSIAAAEDGTDAHATLAELWEKVAEFEEEMQLGKATQVMRDEIMPLLKRLKVQKVAPDAPAEESGPASKSSREARENTSLAKALDSTFKPPKPNTFGFVKQKEVKHPKKFFDKVKVKFPKGSGIRNQPAVKDWAINMAALQHMGAQYEMGSAEHKALASRQLGYQFKFANLNRVRQFGFQSNPLQAAKGNGEYHRQGGTEMTQVATKMVAEEIGVHPANMILVSSGHAIEEVRRQYRFEDNFLMASNWSDEDFGRVLTKALENGASGKEIFVDASETFKDAIAAGKDINTVAESLMNGLERKAINNALSVSGLTRDTLAALKNKDTRTDEENAKLAQALKNIALARERLKKVNIGGIVTVKDQPVITSFTYESKAEQQSFITNKGHQHRGLTSIMNHAGFTVAPNQLIDTMLSLNPDPAAILQRFGIKKLPEVKFPNMRLNPIEDFDQDVLQNPDVQAFEALADDQDAAPFVKVNVNAMMALVKGLESPPHSVKDKLEEADLGGVWTLLINKILSLMAEAVAIAGEDPLSMKRFLNVSGLIQEEVANLVCIAKPYTEDDFVEATSKSMAPFPDGFLSFGITVDYTLKNSGSRCFNAVLTACEDAKEVRAGEKGELAKRGLQVLVQAGSYYEPSDYVMHEAIEVRTTKADTNPEAFTKVVDEIAESGNKLDTFVCEFHHNISTDKKTYEVENVTEQVKILLKKKVVAHPFTITIDATIGKQGDESIKQFLNEFKKRIEDGTINVVIFRSSQKFDQLGADQFNGGVMCVITSDNNDASAPFKAALENASEPPTQENLQGLTHINLAAAEQVDDYRDAISENVRKITRPDPNSDVAIPREFLALPENADKSVVQIAFSEDDETPFIDIRFNVAGGHNRSSLYSTVTMMFELMSQENEDDGPMVATRSSFGFQHANVTPINSEKLRLNPGLEDDRRLALYSKVFKDLNDVLTPLLQDYLALENELGTGVTLEPPYSNFASKTVREDLLKYGRIAADESKSADERNAARLAIMEKYGTQNPMGVLRLFNELTQDAFEDAALSERAKQLLNQAIVELERLRNIPAPSASSKADEEEQPEYRNQQEKDEAHFAMMQVHIKKQNPGGVADAYKDLSQEFLADSKTEPKVTKLLEQAENMRSIFEAELIFKNMSDQEARTALLAYMPEGSANQSEAEISESENEFLMQKIESAAHMGKQDLISKIAEVMDQSYRENETVEKRIAKLQEIVKDPEAPELNVPPPPPREEDIIPKVSKDEATQRRYLQLYLLSDTAERASEFLNLLDEDFIEKEEIAEIIDTNNPAANGNAAHPANTLPNEKYLMNVKRLSLLKKFALADDIQGVKDALKLLPTDFRRRPDVRKHIELAIAGIEMRKKTRRKYGTIDIADN